MTDSNGNPVSNPTWYANIRQLFTDTDIDHMKSQGLDLTSYEEVKASAGGIYGQVAAGNMPPGAPWSADNVSTFLNWMSTGYPKGTSPQPTRDGALKLKAAQSSSASRIRKDVTTLTDAEMANLKKAFSAMMAMKPDDPNSYFVQAGYHWLPAPLYCQHHVPAYNPWHRAYLISFENALRSVPGCEDVTLPYWDITTPFPDVLKAAPFDSYTLPENIGEGFNKGYVTQRFPYPEIQSNLVAYGVTEDLNRALTKTDWEDFHGYWSGSPYNTIIAAHDAGHGSIGPTMSNQSVAAFDPIFWFFHANWDRLFWKWQQGMNATNLNGLLSTINKQTDVLSYQIFTLPALETLAPFTANPPKLDTLAIIDSENSLDVDYAEPPTAVKMSFLTKARMSASAAEKFSVETARANVRVEGLNRLKIPGSFKVHLLKDGERIASRFMFQPNEADKCPNCVKNAIVHFDFELPLKEVADGKLSVVVEPVDTSLVGDRFPQKMMGNPTVSVQLLMKTE
jgi:tyrosinase